MSNNVRGFSEVNLDNLSRIFKIDRNKIYYILHDIREYIAHCSELDNHTFDSIFINMSTNSKKHILIHYDYKYTLIDAKSSFRRIYEELKKLGLEIKYENELAIRIKIDILTLHNLLIRKRKVFENKCYHELCRYLEKKAGIHHAVVILRNSCPALKYLNLNTNFYSMYIQGNNDKDIEKLKQVLYDDGINAEVNDEYITNLDIETLYDYITLLKMKGDLK